MKKALIASALIAMFAAPAVQAHGCSGNQACTQDTTIYNANPHIKPDMSNYSMPEQNQKQRQRQQQEQNAAVNNNHNSRYLSIRPVNVAPTPIVTPAANISRYASQECGPQQIVLSRTVNGLNNRPIDIETVEAGYDQYVVPADMPYRKVQLTPHVYQLIGHRLVETSAVTTVSTGGGFGFGLNVNAGGGGSMGAQSAGAIQRVVTTIRLQECVAYEVDTRPLKPRG